MSSSRPLRTLNGDLEQFCSSSSGTSLRRLYGFGLLPLVPDISIDAILEAITQISQCPHLKGTIMSTRGVGNGLDDSMLDSIWVAWSGRVSPPPQYYGVDNNAWGGNDNGHVLPLALGFPFETIVAMTRLILSGVLDRFPSLRILLAHAGGILPRLSSHLASCIDPVVASRPKHDVRYYLGKLFYDAVAFGYEELGLVNDVIAESAKCERPIPNLNRVDRKAGSMRILFGTDHPFFPPLSATEKWKSVVDNLEAIEGGGTSKSTA